MKARLSWVNCMCTPRARPSCGLPHWDLRVRPGPPWWQNPWLPLAACVAPSAVLPLHAELLFRVVSLQNRRLAGFPSQSST